MGPYPLFSCRDWSALAADLTHLADSLVSVTIVADPFGDHDETVLRTAFPDVARPFRVHDVADLTREPSSYVARHHRRAARKGLAVLDIERVPEPSTLLSEWVVLYANLIDRHEISGVRAFTREAFETQLAVPGLVAFRASYEGQAVGMMLWYRSGDVAHFHLAAFSTLGYELFASHALTWSAIRDFAADQLRWVDLGGAPAAARSAGLERFKAGWSTDTRLAYVCGRIVNPVIYKALVATRTAGSSAYFPAYREGEFT